MEESLLDSIEYMIPESSLEYLRIFSCPDMNISMSRCYHLLETLEIEDGSDSLRTFQLDNFPKLCKLYLKCRYLQKISQTRCHNHLKDLEICGHHSSELNLEYPFASVATEALFSGKETSTPWQERSEELVILQPQFQSFPSKGLSAPSLKRLSIQRLKNLKLLPQRMQVLLQSLDELLIEDCPNVELPDGGLPSNLKKMDLSRCSKLIASLKGALRHNTSLEVLSIQRVNVKFFPGDVFLPLSLTSLSLYDCPLLQQLDNKGLRHLSSLEKLILRDCPFLECLPKEGLPKSISTLKILGNCEMLNQRCQKPKGEDWGKINHIESVTVDIPQSELHMHQFSFI